MGKRKSQMKREMANKGSHLLSTPISASHEFEGLAGFEELSSCVLLKKNKYGKIKREIWENGKIVKKKNQIKSKKCNEEDKLGSTSNKEKESKKKKAKKKKATKSAEGSKSKELSDNTESQTGDKENSSANNQNTESQTNQHVEEQKVTNAKKRKKKKKKKQQQQALGEEGGPSKKMRYDTTSYQGSEEAGREKVDVSAWEQVFAPPPVLEALAELGFSCPTEIQKLVLPAAIKGRMDIIGAAETGSGKTLAFAIPIIHGILEDKRREALEETSDSGVEHSGGEGEDSSDGDLEGEGNSEDEMEKVLGSVGQMEKEENSDEEDQNSDEEDQRNMMDSCEGDSDEEDGMTLLNREIDSDDQSDGEAESCGEDMEGLGCVKVIDNANFDFLEGDGISTIKKSPNKLWALIVTPTRELAIQVKSHVSAVLRHTDLRAAVVVGGMAAQKQERLLRSGPDIVVGTPGRLWELIQQSNAHLSQVSEVRYLAIDETDRMVERGHFQELTHLLELINSNEAAKMKRQTFVFSATLSTVHEAPKRFNMKKVEKMTSEMKISQLANLIGLKPKPKIVDVTKSFGTVASLTEAKINCMKEEKDFYLYYFLKCYPGRTLVFCNSINCVRRLQNLFTLLQCNPQSLHASKHQKQRLKSLEHFSSNPKAVLLATDVAARGLDIPNIQHVIHYQVPHTAETYIHRSGRTARATKEGLSIILVESGEMRKYRQLCTTLARPTGLPPFPTDLAVMGQVKQRVKWAGNLEKIEHRQRKSHAEEDWLRKAAKEAELLVEEDEYDPDVDREKTMRVAKEKRELKAKRDTLARMLATPLLSSGFSGKYPTQTGSLVLPYLATMASLGKDSKGGAGNLGTEDGMMSNRALSVVKKESLEFTKLMKKVKIKAPVKKINKKKFKGFDKRKKKIQKEREEYMKKGNGESKL